MNTREIITERNESNDQEILPKEKVSFNVDEVVLRHVSALRVLSDNIVEIISTFNTDFEKEVVIKDQTPEKSVQIKVWIESLHQKIDSQGTLLKEYYDLLNKITEEVSEFEIKNLEDVHKLELLVKKSLDIFVSVKKNEVEIERMVDLYNLSQKNYKKVLLKELNLGSIDELKERLDQVRINVRSKKKEAFGLGKFLNMREISLLDKEEHNLRSIRTGYTLSSELTNYTRDQSTSIGVKIVSDLIDKIETLSKISVEEITKVSANVKEKISSELINELDTSFIDQVVVPHFNPEDSFSEAEIKRCVSILRKSFALEMYFNNGEDAETTKKREEIQREIEELSYKERNIVSYYIQRENKADDIWLEFNNGMSSLRTQKYLSELKTTLESIRHSCTKDRGSKTRGISFEKVKWPLHAVYYKFAREGLRLDLSKFDTSRWKVFASNKKTKEIYGTENLDTYQKIVEDKNLDSLCLEDSDNKDRMALVHLMELGSIDTLPYIMLAAFRFKGDNRIISMGYGNDPKSTEFYRYIISLSQDSLQKVKEIHPVEVSEILSLIKDNPDTFCIKTISTPTEDGGYAYKDNQICTEISAKLEALSCRYFESKNERGIRFVLKTIANQSEPMSSQAPFLKAILDDKSHYSPEITSKVVEVLYAKFYYYKDIEALKILLESDQLLSPEKNLNILKMIASDWKDTHFFKENEDYYKDSVSYLSDHFSTKLKEMFDKNTLNDAYLAYRIAKNLNIPPRPTSFDILSMLRNKEQLEDVDNTSVISNLYDLANGLVFTEAESFDFVKIFIKFTVSNSLTTHDKEYMSKFFEQLSLSEGFNENDKKELFLISKLLMDRTLGGTLLGNDSKITEENWASILSLYALIEGGVFYPEKEFAEKIAAMFSNLERENRDLCLDNLKNIWQDYLNDPEHILTIRGLLVAEAIKGSGGEAGGLKYISALTNMINGVSDLSQKSKLASVTRITIFEGLKTQEEKMDQAKWSEEEKFVFYTVSKSIMHAAPSLYTDFLHLFNTMSGKQIKKFVKEIYPLYQAQLVVLEKEEGLFSGKDLIPIRKRIEKIILDLGNNSADQDEVFEKEKKEIINSVQKAFENRFGLLKVPDTLTEENIRTLENCVRYIGNVNDRNDDKELVISMYLGLNLNGDWEKFRAGELIDLSGYFKGEKLRKLENLLDKRGEINTINPDAIGLSHDETNLFIRKLQKEVISNTIGNIETIDLKLGNVKRNLEGLTDPDIYPDPSDREVLDLIINEGKLVGSTLAKIYGEVIGKKVNFDGVEKKIKKVLENIYRIEKWTPELVKNTQDKIQPLSLICGVLRKIKEEKVDSAIEELQKAVTPSSKVVEIFNKIDENFKAGSGALALSQDLSYLENIIFKNQDKLTTEDRGLLDTYLGFIREKMSVLESVYTRVKEHFEKIKKGAHVVKNELLNSRLKEIEKIMYQSENAQSLNTRFTNDINLIIENMRECLGCLKKEVNNDTNLTFGDLNKFYIMSQDEKLKGSISDEIVYFFPIKTSEGEQEMSFVMDRIYGSKSSDILIAHIKCVAKKYLSLKKDFSEAKISVLITDSALSSAGLSRFQAREELLKIFEGAKIFEEDEILVNVPESALGDNYIEFAKNSGRRSGENESSGLRVSI